MKYGVVIILINIVILLSGCVQEQIIDDINIETAVGYDLAENDKIKGTLLFPTYLPDQSVQNNTLVSTFKESRRLSDDLSKKSNRQIVTGSLDVVLFGRNLATKGFFNLIDSYMRDPNIGSRIDLAVVDGESQEVLQGQYGTKGNSLYIKNLLDHNMRYGNVPRTNLHLFTSHLYTKGRTTFLPMIKKLNNNQLKINGLALFNNQYLVQTIPDSEIYYFKLLVGKNSLGDNSIKYDNKVVVIKTNASKNQIKVHKGNPIKIEVNISIVGTIREYTGEKLNAKDIEGVTKAFNKKVKRVTMGMLKEFQHKGIDPVGVGQRVKSETRNFNWKNWRHEYQNTQFDVNSKLTITESGTVQ
jgi:spore germination protein